MKILAVSDAEDRALSQGFSQERWGKAGIQLIVSCGDLKPSYLDYLVSRFNVPCYYVRGNHDTTYTEADMGGCVNLDERLQTYRDVRFFGLEGSRWYNGGPAQYTERQMRTRIFWANWQLFISGGVDVVVTHSPPRICPLPEKKCRCLNPPPGQPPALVGQDCYVEPERRNWDMADLPHRPFDSLRGLVMRHQPRLLLHGHTHLGYGARPRELMLGKTRVVDVYGHVVLDV